ncbi:MAG: thioredoxin family protein [Planctomycetaceae bacterium]
MVKTASTMLPLGRPAPDFSLPNVDGKTVSLSDFSGKKGLVVIFMCNHCPFVKHLASALADFGKEYQEKGLGVVAISSNDVGTHPDDSPELMKAEAVEQGYTFPYLYDETQGVAQAYKAACTPDFYLFDKDMLLVYRGQFDSSRPGNGELITGADLRAACDAVLAGEPVEAMQKPSIGCNIKWKSESTRNTSPVNRLSKSI